MMGGCCCCCSSERAWVDDHPCFFFGTIAPGDHFNGETAFATGPIRGWQNTRPPFWELHQERSERFGQVERPTRHWGAEEAPAWGTRPKVPQIGP